MPPKKTAKKGQPKKELRHPDHAEELPRLRRVIGQLEAVERMINDKKYCIDIINQLRAANSAGHALELEILKRHLGACIRTAAQSSSPEVFDQKLEEILALIRM